MESGQIPYNLRKLFAVRFPFLTLISLITVVAGLFAFPLWLSLWLGKKERKRVPLAMLLVIVEGLAVYSLLRFAVPLEMVHKIVGYPVLNWPWEWELLGRFVALCAIPTIVLTGGSLCALHLFQKRPPIEPFFRFSILAAVMLSLSHVVVVRFADTDNLTELMEGGGTWMSTMFLCAWFFVISFPSALLALYFAAERYRGVFYVAIAIVLSVPVGYMLLVSGTEADIYKYGKHFSALQFILSPDRDHYLSMHAIILRYLLVHLFLVVAVSFAQVGFWSWRGVGDV
jgi:hypothetical protein